MKNSIFVALAVLTAFLLVASCSRSLPERMDDFVNKVEKNAPGYTEEDWDKVNQQFRDLCQEYRENKGSLTGDEVKQVRSAMSRYVGQVVKSGVQSVSDAIEEIGAQIPGLLEDLGNIFRGIPDRDDTYDR